MSERNESVITPLVSVIMPVYNVERWISESIDSILSQTFSDYEVICIDDCSDDGSSDIVRNYCLKDNRIHLYYNEKNLGLSAVRNRGIDLAKGKYILFMDSDDIIDQDTMKKTVELAEDNSLDIVLFDFEYLVEADVTKEWKKSLSINLGGVNGIFSGEELFTKLENEGRFSVPVCFKLFKRDFIIKNEIRFREGILHEDYLFSFMSIMKCQRAACLEELFYKYRKREGGITNTFDEKRAQSFFYVFLEVFYYWKSRQFSDDTDMAMKHFMNRLYGGYSETRYVLQNEVEYSFSGGADRYLYDLFQANEKTKIRISFFDWNRIKEAKKVYVYGIGNTGIGVFGQILSRGMDITAFLVDSNAQIDKLYGKDVLCIEDSDIERSAIIIIAVKAIYQEKAQKRLNDIGFDNCIMFQSVENIGDYDLIDRAVKRGELKKLSHFKKQSWERFDEALSEGSKKLFVFGSGAGFKYFIRKFGKKYKIEGILDNDHRKQGHSIGTLDVELYDTEYNCIPVYGNQLPDGTDPRGAVILVSPVKNVQEVVASVNKVLKVNCFFLLSMEADRKEKGETIDFESDKTWIHNNEISKEVFAKNCTALPLNRRKVMFFSFENGGRYSDHGKYITEELLKRYENALEIVWTVNDLNSDLPKRVRPIYINNWKSVIKEAETAGIWISCDPLPPYLIKREGQVYIQTKHWASVTLKTFYLDDVSFSGVKDFYDKWEKNGKMMDYCMVGSEFDAESCKRGFRFDGECINVGSPRTDAMFREDECRKKVYEYYNIPSSRKCVIYAPTFRYDKATGVSSPPEHNLDYRGLLSVLKKKFSGDWVLLLRYHPQAVRRNESDAQAEDIIDVCSYPDSQELASASAVMVSDYSSIMFEPAFVDKPVFLYAPDRKRYVGGEREMLIPYDELPFTIAETNEALMKTILDFDYDKYILGLRNFMTNYGVCEDGHASERAADFIIEIMGRKDL